MKKMMGIKRLVFSVAAIFLCSAGFIGSTYPFAFAEARAYKGDPAKYVFLFIGDGMGVPQRTAAEKFSGNTLMMDTFPAQGITTTYAADRFITGSAASATALASGQQTNIGMIGMDSDQRNVRSIAEMAKDKGMNCLLYTSPSPRDRTRSRMPSSA